MYIPPGAIGNMIKKSSKSRETKYKNKKVEFRGMRFDSIGERDRYICLLQEQDDGIITNLRRQIKFGLTCNDIHVCNYIADFVYYRGDDLIVEDFKGVLTDVFQLKAKWFKAQYGFDITVTKRRAWRSSNAMEPKSWKKK